MTIPAGLVSVVMPVYRVERYVGAAIASVLAQSWPNFELIAVDDGSPDRSFEVMRSFSDPRLRPIRLPGNQGVAAARNAALAAARGEFIALLDADDVMNPSRLERQLQFMQRHPEIALCGGLSRIIGLDGKVRREPGNILIDTRAANASLVFANVFCTSSIMLRRDAVPPGGFRQRYAEDYDFLVRVAARHRLGLVNQVVVDYRLRADSATQVCAVEAKKRDVWQSQAPLFEALNVVPTAQEQEIHLLARTDTGNLDAAQLSSIYRWYAKLVRANRNTGVYPDEDFQRAASYVWFSQLFRATGCGGAALRMFFGNSLSFAHPQPLLMHAKFVAKALLRRKFARAGGTAVETGSP